MKNIVLLAVFIVSTVVSAQRAKVTEGNWKTLKDISAYNLVFEYTDVQIPKFDSEEAFLEDKMSKRDDKEPGSGEEFKKNWFADRENRYEPKFIESFNKRFNDGEVSVEKNSEAEYTMKIHTTMLYPGYNVGIVRKNAKLEATLYVYKTDAPETVIFSVNYTKVEGKGAMGHDYNSGYRISEAYAKLAKDLAKKIRKKAK